MTTPAQTPDLASRLSAVSSGPAPTGTPLESRLGAIASQGDSYFHSNPDDTGEQKNDIGQTVIVPKEDESFADTMQRAAAHGKTVTPAQLSAEERTMPAKAAQVLTAAPAIGVAGTAALAGAGAAGEAVAGSGAGQAVAKGSQAVAKLAAKYPKTAAILQYLGLQYSGLFHHIPELPLLIALSGHGGAAAEEEGAAAEGAAAEGEAAEAAPKLPKVPKKVVKQSTALGPNAEVMQKSQALREVPTPATAPEPTAPVATEPTPVAAPEPTAQPTAEPAAEAKPEPKPELPRRRLRALGSPEVDSRVLGDAAESAKKGETADEFVDRLTDGAYKVHDNGKIVEVKPPADEPLTDARQKAVGKQMEGKYEPKEYKRGPYKGKPKMARVFSDGAWHDVPQYGETQAAKAP